MVPSIAAVSGSAHVLALVKSTPTLRRDDIEGLATALLDLGSGYESALRTVLSMQRLLERIRKADEVSPECALLLQEMSRQALALAESGAAMTRCLDEATSRLSTMRGDRTE